MHVALTPEQERLRAELREYFTALVTPEVRAGLAAASGEFGDAGVYKDVIRKLGADGWLGIGWPKEYGGQDRSMVEQLIFTDAAAVAGVPIPYLTLNTVGPTIMRYGTDEQKEYFLPRILAGDLHFSIGYSEPGSGTDLASLKTRAVREGDEWVINGQKMWTSLIQYADWIWLACRTDPDLPRHKGLSMILVPADADGFSYTPVHTVAGVGTSATYYEDVRVPASNLVGELNGGWSLMTNQLNHERVALTSAAPLTHSLGLVRTWAQETKNPDGQRVIDQEWVQVLLGRVHARVEMLTLLNWQLASAVDDLSPAAASATKVYGSELATEVYRSLMEIVGPNALVAADSPAAVLAGRLERYHRSALVMTFGGGTNEIQRDIIGYVGLGLPRTRRGREHGLHVHPRAGRGRRAGRPHPEGPRHQRADEAGRGRRRPVRPRAVGRAGLGRPARPRPPRGVRRRRPRPDRAVPGPGGGRAHRRPRPARRARGRRTPHRRAGFGGPEAGLAARRRLRRASAHRGRRRGPRPAAPASPDDCRAGRTTAGP